METLAQIGVATIELVEAEGRALRRQVVRLAAAAGVGFLLLFIALGGLAFLFFGIYFLLAGVMPPGVAALLVGFGALALAAAGAAAIRRAI
jgi:hypothetical protein